MNIHKTRVTFNIAAPSMEQALTQFAQQTGLQLVVPTEHAAELHAPEVVGRYTPSAALNQLLAGSGLRYQFTNEKTVEILLAGKVHPKATSHRRAAAIVLTCVFSVSLGLLVHIKNAALKEAAEDIWALIRNERTGSEAPQILNTEVGERRSVSLSAGSEAVLNTGSRLNVDPASHTLTLEHGEVVLSFIDRPGGPWVLRYGDIEVEARTAKIHIRHDTANGSSRLDLLSGECRVRPASHVGSIVVGGARVQSLDLNAGQYLLIRNYDVVFDRFNPTEVDRKLAWTQGMLILAGETLAEAVVEFNRYNTRQLVIGDASISALRPGGTFNVTDIDSFTSSLRSRFGVRAIQMRSGGAGPGVIMLVGPGHTSA